ncbi:Ribosomal RNA-processing protein 8 [Camellia lanceoleosa]|uniref:Ribosomal RNA-processing protein 8 n=1 Tax=Camellia lanceoleosa TaxID=1840588 RepID=A0ACC0G0G5_9ERIC|nr:Ribosomal RNA-processing protein 8 [Camellia lanceoleosa]
MRRRLHKSINVVSHHNEESHNMVEKGRHTFFSVDPISTNPDASSIDVAIFCLSLMGTNFSNYLQEAHRVLKPFGWLLIAEVKSRFDPNTGGVDLDKFLKAIYELGFAFVSKIFSTKCLYTTRKVPIKITSFFVLYEKQNSKREIEWLELKPCLYKRR